jgi:hypothetical protein
VGVEEEEDGPQLPLDITMPPRVSQNLVHTADKILVCKVRAEHINKQFNVPGALTQPSPAAVAELQALGIWRYLVVNDVLDGSDGVGTPNRVLLVQTIPMAEDASRLFGWVFWAFINRKDWDPATYLRGCIEGHGEYVARTLKYLKETKFLTGQMVVVEPMFDIATTTKVSAVAQWNMQSSEAGRQAQIVGHRPEAIESRTALDPSVFLGLEYLGNHMGGGDPLALDPAEYVDQATGCFSFPRRTRPYLTLLTDLAALRNPVLFFNTRLPGLPNRDLRPPSSVEVRAMRGLRAARSRCEPGAESMEDVKRQVFAASLHRMIETTEGQLAKIEGAAVAAAQILSAVDEEALALMNKHGGRYVVRMSGMRPEIRRAASRGRFTIDALRSDPRLWGGFTRLHALLACSARKRAWTVVSDYVSATAHLPPAIKSCAEHVDQLLESDAHTLFAHKPRRANGPLVTGLEDLWGLWFYAKKVQNVHRNFRAYLLIVLAANAALDPVLDAHIGLFLLGKSGLGKTFVVDKALAPFPPKVVLPYSRTSEKCFAVEVDMSGCVMTSDEAPPDKTSSGGKGGGYGNTQAIAQEKEIISKGVFRSMHLKMEADGSRTLEVTEAKMQVTRVQNSNAPEHTLDLGIKDRIMCIMIEMLRPDAVSYTHLTLPTM